MRDVVSKSHLQLSYILELESSTAMESKMNLPVSRLVIWVPKKNSLLYANTLTGWLIAKLDSHRGILESI